jgi:dienelactone hydrolase
MKPLAGEETGFALLIAMYPWCGDQPLDFRPAGDAPLHMLLGANDTYAGVEPCREFAKKFEMQGGKLSLKIYPGAQHGWDTPGSTDWTDGAGQNASKCVYDETSPGTWILRGSHIKVTENYKTTGNRKQALAACMTLGVSGGYSAQVRAKSLQDIRGAIREAFQLR